MIFKKLVLSISAAGAVALLPMGAAKADISGLVKVMLEVQSGCHVNASAAEQGNGNDFGVLDFGRTGPVWSNVLTAELSAGKGNNALQVTCDSGVGGFKVAVDGGINGGRKLMGEDGSTIAYQVYRDPGRSQVFEVDTPVTYDVIDSATPVPVPVYGAIAPNSQDAVTAGLYSDIMTVTFSF